MIVFDVSYAIPFLSEVDPRHEEAMTLVDAIAGDPVGIGSITLAEVLLHPARAGRAQEARGYIAELDIDEIAFPSDGAMRLAALRVATGLNLPDCAAVLAAQEARATAVATLDDRMRAALPALGLQRVA